MPRKQVRRIYLAGPITGCNDEQKKVWRDRIQRLWSQEFEFYCPVQRLEELNEKGVRITPYQVVNLDMRAIQESDAVIANILISHGASTLYTKDRDFLRFKGLKVVEPF